MSAEVNLVLNMTGPSSVEMVDTPVERAQFIVDAVRLAWNGKGVPSINIHTTNGQPVCINANHVVSFVLPEGVH